jgi:hypothetical protein
MGPRLLRVPREATENRPGCLVAAGRRDRMRHWQHLSAEDAQGMGRGTGTHGVRQWRLAFPAALAGG